MKSLFLQFAVLVLAIMPLSAQDTTSTNVVKEVAEGVKFIEVEKCEFKDITTFQLSIKLSNENDIDYSVKEGSITVMLSGAKVAVMNQTGVATLSAKSGELVVESVWKVVDYDFMNMMLLTLQMSKSDYSGLTADVSFTFMEGTKEYKYAKDGLDLEKYMTIFAPSLF